MASSLGALSAARRGVGLAASVFLASIALGVLVAPARAADAEGRQALSHAGPFSGGAGGAAPRLPLRPLFRLHLPPRALVLQRRPRHPPYRDHLLHPPADGGPDLASRSVQDRHPAGEL